MDFIFSAGFVRCKNDDTKCIYVIKVFNRSRKNVFNSVKNMAPQSK